MVCSQLAVGVGAGVVFASRVHHVIEESSLGFTGMMVDALASVGGILRVKMQVWALVNTSLIVVISATKARPATE